MANDQKVTRLFGDEFLDFLEAVKEAHNDDRIDTFICITRTKHKKGEEVPGFTGIPSYWFSEKESTVYCLGLCDVMKDNIREYMRDLAHNKPEDE